MGMSECDSIRSFNVFSKDASNAHPASVQAVVPGWTLSDKAPNVALNLGKTAFEISALNCSMLVFFEGDGAGVTGSGIDDVVCTFFCCLSSFLGKTLTGVTDVVSTDLTDSVSTGTIGCSCCGSLPWDNRIKTTTATTKSKAINAYRMCLDRVLLAITLATSVVD